MKPAPGIFLALMSPCNIPCCSTQGVVLARDNSHIHFLCMTSCSSRNWRYRCVSPLPDLFLKEAMIYLVRPLLFFPIIPLHLDVMKSEGFSLCKPRGGKPRLLRLAKCKVLEPQGSILIGRNEPNPRLICDAVTSMFQAVSPEASQHVTSFSRQNWMLQLYRCYLAKHLAFALETNETQKWGIWMAEASPRNKADLQHVMKGSRDLFFREIYREIQPLQKKSPFWHD